MLEIAHRLNSGKTTGWLSFLGLPSTAKHFQMKLQGD